jgi:hypothetical protein
MIVTRRLSRTVLLVISPVVLGMFGLSEVFGVEGSKPNPTQKAVGAVELKAPTTPLKPINTCCPEATRPAVDVSALSIRSDGSRITLAATLKDPPGTFATAPVTIYIDSDNNPATGLKAIPELEMPGGFEYKAALTLCIKYADGSESCDGGSKAQPTERNGAINLERFKGDSENNADTVVDAIGFPGRKPSVRVPLKGQVLESSIEYVDLNIKPGQTIRLLAKRSGGGGVAPAFPVILLTLK